MGAAPRAGWASGRQPARGARWLNDVVAVAIVTAVLVLALQLLPNRALIVVEESTASSMHAAPRCSPSEHSTAACRITRAETPLAGMAHEAPADSSLAREQLRASPEIPSSDSSNCWKVPSAALSPPFNENMASVVWSKPVQTTYGPLDDVSAEKRQLAWPPALRAQLVDVLPEYEQMRKLRYRTCAVVGSSPEVKLYEDGAEIDSHDAVFRANIAITRGFEKYVGNRTTLRVINPVESIRAARKRQGDSATIVIKNQDPPSIRDPSSEHQKFLTEKLQMISGGAGNTPEYLSRRHIIELCNFLFLQSGVALADPALAKYAVNLTAIAQSFGEMARSNNWHTWHPMGDGIPRFSGAHCSTGTVLLTEALLLCDKVRAYGFHVCDCQRACKRDGISTFNHYWDARRTSGFELMAARYSSHLRFYHRLREACDFDFEIARLEHCDAPYPQRRVIRRIGRGQTGEPR